MKRKNDQGGTMEKIEFIKWKNRHWERLVNQYISDNVKDFEVFCKEEYEIRTKRMEE